MGKPPPARAVAITERLRWGLQGLERKLVPAPIALLDFVNGFWGAQIVYTLAELEIVDALRAGPRSAADVARELGLDPDVTYRLLRAGSNVDVVREEEGQRFRLTAVGQALCQQENESFRDFIILMGRAGTRFWSRLPDCVRTGKTGIELETGKQPFELIVSDEELRRVFNRAMTAVSSVAADALTAAYDFSGLGEIADIGGGQGRLLAAMLKAAPGARGVLFDLPEVVESAPAVLEALGVADRTKVVGGSFFEPGAVPERADLYMMKAIVHDWSDEDAAKILSNVRKAAKPDSTLLLYEAVVPGPGEKHFAKFLDIEMVVMAGGRERTRLEFSSLLTGAGFRLTRVVPTAGPISLVEAKPA